MSFSKSRPCSSHEPSSTMHNDEEREKKINNESGPSYKNFNIPKLCCCLTLSLLICDLSANWITFKAHQVPFALTAWSDSSVHPAVLIIQARASKRMYCLPPLYDSCGLSLGTFFKSPIQIRAKNGDCCSIMTLKQTLNSQTIRNVLPPFNYPAE